MIQAVITEFGLCLKRRSAWLVVGLAFIVWPLCILYSPLASTLTDARAANLAKELAFVSVLVALAFGEKRQDEYSWMQLRLSQGRRRAKGFMVRTLTGCGVGWMALLPATLLGGQLGIGSYLELTISCAHMSATYVLLAALGFSASVRSVMVAFFALAIPAAIKNEGGASQALHSLLNPRSLSIAEAPSWGLTAAQITVICILMLLSTCLDSSRSR